VRDDPRRAVLFTTHDLSEVDDLCERVAVLQRGRCLWSSSVAALRQRFGGEEVVTLTARGVSARDFDGPGGLQLAAPATATADGVVVRFAPGAGGSHLARAVDAVVRAGGAVVACRTERRPLQEIFAALVHAGAANAGNATPADHHA
jgi:ABC-type multidrug transport system ATPase subunit